MHLPVAQIPLQACARSALAQRGIDPALSPGGHAGLGHGLAFPPAHRRAETGKRQAGRDRQGSARSTIRRARGRRGPGRHRPARGCRGDARGKHRAFDPRRPGRSRAMDRRPAAHRPLRFHRRCERALPADRRAPGRWQGRDARGSDRRAAEPPSDSPAGRPAARRRGRARQAGAARARLPREPTRCRNPACRRGLGDARDAAHGSANLVRGRILGSPGRAGADAARRPGVADHLAAQSRRGRAPLRHAAGFLSGERRAARIGVHLRRPVPGGARILSGAPAPARAALEAGRCRRFRA